jgi:protein SCO1/2
VLEDQDGERVRLLDLIGSNSASRPALVAFFYTRCMNPLKCSLTISRLGDALRSSSLPPFEGHAISYDGDYDEPSRLRGYGEDRRFPFAPKARLLRCVKGRQAMKTAFDLQFGFGGFTVNQHARELFLLTRDGHGLRLPPELLARHDALAEVLRRI